MQKSYLLLFLCSSSVIFSMDNLKKEENSKKRTLNDSKESVSKEPQESTKKYKFNDSRELVSHASNHEKETKEKPESTKKLNDDLSSQSRLLQNNTREINDLWYMIRKLENQENNNKKQINNLYNVIRETKTKLQEEQKKRKKEQEKRENLEKMSETMSAQLLSLQNNNALFFSSLVVAQHQSKLNPSSTRESTLEQNPPVSSQFNMKWHKK